MPSWEDTKRAAQSAYIMAGNGFQDVHNSIGNAYQQILISGHLYPSMGGNSLTQEIAEGAYEPTKEDWKEYERHLDEQQPEQEQDMEPER
ncbi:hypothetical protein KSC_054330 [Ktedonobacter sp. SOSP1-52]|uniref:hypothetical protein n=1 Tax=Ktedonobacter sp. SOSP1-52 TaxID=2778366 RepID=UPI0019152006|nr:hypothetical protein [Ktedonobacter sp. SOSP1-52]GHO66541.1 hypothetical protein KSC_054330 [Ktedonobacter sp. SOSP1-52]